MMFIMPKLIKALRPKAGYDRRIPQEQTIMNQHHSYGIQPQSVIPPNFHLLPRHVQEQIMLQQSAIDAQRSLHLQSQGLRMMDFQTDAIDGGQRSQMWNDLDNATQQAQAEVYRQMSE